MKLDYKDYAFKLWHSPYIMMVYYRGTPIALIQEERTTCDALYKVFPQSNPLTNDDWELLADYLKSLRRGIKCPFISPYYSFSVALEAIDSELPKYLKKEFLPEN